MTSAALKLYTAGIAIICAVAIAWSINQSAAASTWRTEVGRWQSVAQQTVAHDRHTVHQYRKLAHRYNQLVLSTRRSQRRLLANMNTVQSAPVAPISALAPPTPGATASAPTTHTS